jgi:tripartite-type tricarboxylate transporter receptor subunit TctC
MTSRIARRVACGIALLVLAATSVAQGYPVRPIRIIVPFAPGAPDTLARILGQQLGMQMGQSVIVENRPGANGLIGADLVAKAPADGYTILLTSTSYAVNPSTYKKMPFDPVRDLLPVINACGIEALILAVNPTLPVQTLEGLLLLAKRPDSNLSFGSPGVGNSLHLAGEMLNDPGDVRDTAAIVAAYPRGQIAAACVYDGYPCKLPSGCADDGRSRTAGVSTRWRLVHRLCTERYAARYRKSFGEGVFDCACATCRT